MIKRLFLIVFVGCYAVSIKAKQNDTTIYNGCEGDNSRTGISINSHVFYADKCPVFTGGIHRLNKYLVSNIHIPNRLNILPGRMVIEFVVEKDGRVNYVKVLKGNNKDINNEVIRVLKKSPKWIPATFKDNPVRCYYTIPLVLDLQGT